MKKKEPIKISLSTFFLILAIIVIAVMGYFIYKIYNEKIIVEKKSNELQSTVNSLKKNVSDLQEKIDKGSEITENINQPNREKTENATVEGVYIWKNPDGTEVEYTFLNGKFKMEGSWTYEGSYKIYGNKIVLKTEYTYDYSTMNKIKVEGEDKIEIEGIISENTITLKEKEMTRILEKIDN